MKQKLLNSIRLRVCMLVAILCTAFAGQAWGDVYQKVTSESDLEYGKKYIIVCESSNKALGGISTTSTKYGLPISVEITDDEITIPNGVNILTLHGSKSGGWSFITSLYANNYLYWGSGNSLNKTTTEKKWEITFSDGNAVIAFKDDTSRKIKFNSDRFACYTSAQTSIQLYKEVEVTLSSIAISGTYPTNFHQGDAFSHDGMTVTATYDDESTDNVTTSATFSGYNMSSTGVQTVTVSYTENGVTKTATYDITVSAPATLTSIALSGTYPTVFDYGAAFSSEGIVVTANYDDDTNKVVTGSATFSGYNMTTAGAQTVTVSYTEDDVTKTQTYGITVNAYVQPTEFDINFNDAFFGTSYGGSASGITDDNPESGSLDNVTVTYAGTGNHYINDSQIRFYPSNKLTFEAPSGYTITKIVFTSGGTWAATISANVGTYTSGTKTWTGEATSVLFTGSGSSRCDMSKAAITLTKQKELSSIAVSGTYPTEFEVGDEFSHEGAVVTATYDDDSNADVTASATFSGYNMSAAGEQTVTVSYTENAVERSTTYDITVKTPAALESIALSGSYPTTFNVGDEFSHEGMTVTATFDDESNADVTASATFSGYDMSAAGEQTVTVSYTHKGATTKTTTYVITVNTVPVTGVSLKASTEIELGDTETLTPTFTPSTASNKNVTWESDNTDVATVSDAGVVTAVAAGTATITVTTEDGGFTATCEVTVTLPKGTVDNPYTVAEVRSFIVGGGTGNKYTIGIVSQAGTSLSSGKMTYYISDDGTTTNQLMIYSGKNLDNTDFTATSDLEVGDRVVIYGPVIYYNSTTPEYTTGNYVYSISRDFTLTLDEMTNGSVAVQVNGVAQEPNGDGDVTVASGATVTLTATPADGYTFGKWSCTTDTWDNSTDNPLEFTMPFEDVMFGATFADASVKYDIVVDDAVEGGSIEADLAKAKAGATVTLTATPDDGYVFDSWDVQDESSNTVTVTSNQFTMPASGVTVTATFLPVYTVNYYIGGVKNSTTRVSGEELNLDSPSTGFAGWSTANSAASPVFMANDAAVTSNLDVYAIFITSYSADYRLVEADQADWRGDYLIAYDDDTFADGRKGGTDSGCIGASGVSVDPDSNLSGKVVDLAWGDTYKVTLEAINNSKLSDGYVLKTQDNKYNYQTGNKNGLSATAVKATAANYPITVTFTSSSDVKLSLGGSAAGAVFRYNTDGYFRYYKDGGQSAVYLYKRTLNATYSLDMHEAITIGSAGYTTYVTPSKVEFPTGVKGYIATATHPSTVTLTEVTTVPADEPIVVKADAGTYYLPVVTTAADDVSSNLLLASDGSVTGDGSIYALGVGKSGVNKGVVGFYLVNDGQTIPAGKAYLNTGGLVKEFLTFDFDDATAIAKIQDSGSKIQDSEIFNLAGQKMSKLQKGVNIVNGKKVLVK